MVNEFQRTKVHLRTPPFARKYEPNYFFDFKQSIVKEHLFKFFVYSEIVFLELTFIGSTSRHIQMTPAVMLNMIPNIKYTFAQF